MQVPSKWPQEEPRSLSMEEVAVMGLPWEWESWGIWWLYGGYLTEKKWLITQWDIYGDLMGYYSDLMGFYSDLMGY